MVAKNGDTVEVNYIGMLEDGSVFDSSVRAVAEKAGILDAQREYGPLRFRVGEGMLIEGFEKGVIGMDIGEKRRISIPPEYAYGSEGRHPLAGKRLIFEIELVKIEEGP